MRRPANCGCRCSVVGPEFIWGRYIRRVGAVTANASLSDFSEAWTSYEALAATESPPVTEMKMAPIRYELGPIGSGNYSEYVSKNQHNVGTRDTAPPITGHLLSTSVSEVQIPGTIAVDTGNLSGRNSADSILRAAELYHNGSSLGLFDFGSAYQLDDNSIPGSYFTHNPLVLALSSVLSMSPSDTLSFDLYTHAKARSPGYMSSASGAGNGVVVANPGTRVTAPRVGTCQITGTTSRVSEITGYKIVFSDSGPGGITELELHAQSGWTVDSSGMVFTRDSGGCVITFNWQREIPYVEISQPDLANSFTTKVRYYQNGSGDYTAIQITSTLTLTYCVWDYTAAALFSSRVALNTGSTNWYSDLEITDSPYFDGFPTTVTVQAI